MILHDPVIITPHLLPGVQVGDAFISIEYYHNEPDGRVRYRYHIDSPAGDYTASDLRSGCQGGSLQSGLASLLCFLSAFAEAVSYSQRTGRESENLDLFPESLREWAYANSDEFSMLLGELEQERELIEE